MPKEKEDVLRLISMGCDGKLQNIRSVCKKLPIFAVKGRPFNGKVLHTSKVMNQGGQLFGVTR